MNAMNAMNAITLFFFFLKTMIQTVQLDLDYNKVQFLLLRTPYPFYVACFLF